MTLTSPREPLTVFLFTLTGGSPSLSSGQDCDDYKAGKQTPIIYLMKTPITTTHTMLSLNIAALCIRSVRHGHEAACKERSTMRNAIKGPFPTLLC